MKNSGGPLDSKEDSIPLVTLQDVNSYKSLIEPTCMQCEVCDQTFNTRFSSIKHNATHIIIPLLKLTLHQCDECLFHFSLEDLRSHVLKTSHHTTQFPGIKIKASQIHTLKTVGYEKLLQNIVRKQAVIKCQDTLYNLKSTDELPNSNSKTDVCNTKARNNEVKDDTASNIKVKKDTIYEISSEPDTEEYKLKIEFPDQDTQIGSSEHERDSSSPFRKDMSSPGPILSPSYEPIRNRIVFEDDDDLFEAEEILPDKPYSPKKSKVPISGTNISMMDKTGNSFLIGRQPNKLDELSRSYLQAIQKRIEEDSNQIVDKSMNNGKLVTNSGNYFVHKRTPVIFNGNNGKPVKTIGNNVFNNGKPVITIGNIVVNNGKPVIIIGNNGKHVTASRNNAVNNGGSNINDGKIVKNNERPVFSYRKHAVNNIIVDRNFNNEISNIVEETYTESVHYDELIVPQLCDCRYCGRCFSNRMELIIHESVHMQIRPTTPILCCVCEKYLCGNYKTLRKHMLRKHPTDIDRKFKVQQRCRSCHMKFYDFLKHMRLYHLTYACSKCQRFFDKEHINNHNCSANTPTLNTYKVIKLCEMCLAFVRNKTNLHYEVTGQHSEVGTRQACDKCHSKYFEVNLVRRKTKHREGATKSKKPMSNTDRLKKMQNRLKVMKQLNKC